ncbi:hypothetical protein N431DRAFT_540373 [Stipitochalara longipes BDJ]|nr:hypothetical protein N431DRAFT_540373 [Stipitochalara longipes BDJ]
MIMLQNTTAFFGSEVSSTRTVFDILWSCLFTIFACTWTVQHLNVPLQREECDIKPGWKGNVKYALKNFWTSATWMIITILAPEVLISLNTGQLTSAMNIVHRLKALADEDGVPWSLTHSLFANMGGFVVREFVPERTHSSSHFHCKVEKEETEPKYRNHSETSINAVSPARTKVPSSKEAADEELEAQPRQEPKSLVVLAHDILVLREKGIIRLPYITRDEIMDKGKSDSFARVIAISQTLWLIVQMIVRSSRHLEVSQLEVGTAAFASCAITIYALNWHKPKGVGVPWTIWSFSSFLPKDISKVLENQPPSNEYIFLHLFNRKSTRGSSIPNHHRHGEQHRRKLWIDNESAESTGLILSSAIFGAIHFAALKSTFPSHVEKISWCVASAVCTGIVVIYFLVAVVVAMCYKMLLWACSVARTPVQP